MYLRFVLIGFLAAYCVTTAYGEETSQSSVIVFSQTDDDVESDEKPILAFTDNPAFEASVNTTLLSFADAHHDVAPYWIGLMCTEPGDALRKQLGLNDDCGLLVETVTEDSPAVKAGIQRFDVLVSAKSPADGTESPTELKEVKHLVEQIQKSQTKPMQIELFRAGKRLSINVTPAERPKQNTEGGNQEHFQVILDDDAKQAGALKSKSLQFRYVVGPTVAINVVNDGHAKLPEGMTVEFRQVVGQPEKILITKGDQKWEVTESELGTLPEDVRGPVQQQLAIRRVTLVSQSSVPTVVSDVDLEKTKKPLAIKYQAHVVRDSNPSSLPEDLTITVTRHGSEPVKATVKKGDQTYEGITIKDLGKLPEELRPIIASSLSQAGKQSISIATKRASETTASQLAKEAAEKRESIKARVQMLQGRDAKQSAEAQQQSVDLQKRLAEAIEQAINQQNKAVAAAAAVPTSTSSEKLEAAISAKVSNAVERKVMKRIEQLDEKIDRLVKALDKASEK